MSAPLVRIHVLISGVVQGVGYRYATTRQAQRLGLNGWVRNLPDGRVEAVFEGDRAAVERAITWCHSGSPAAQVSQVAAQEEAFEGLSGFEVIS
ncbi:MAG: acylphosphatase [Spirulinaceae cyanobacterium SM2_1_0]|nr:acylphosphatase [Spirulinaceae cyanobacterium SM2_1_0]